MASGTLFVSVKTLHYLFVLSLYAPIAWACYRHLFPRLLPSVRRLAGGVLLAQILLIVLSLEVQPRSAYERWLWTLNAEWNIPATFASTQLALVGALALTTAWRGKGSLLWRRLYFSALGLIFLHLARDEYFALHEYVSKWQTYYAGLGLAVAGATLIIAARSRRQSWIWYACFLVGLAVSASGAFIVEDYRHLELCGNWGFLGLDGCLAPAPFEEYLELSGIFLALVAMLGLFSEQLPSPSQRIQRALYIMPALWIILLVGSSAIPPISRQAYAQPADVTFEPDVGLRAFRIEREKRGVNAHLFISPGQRRLEEIGLSIQLVDQVTGESVASRDRYANAQLDFFLAPGYVPVYRQWLSLKFPPDIRANRAYWIALALWRGAGDAYPRQLILESDRQRLSETQVILGELALPSTAMAPQSAPLAAFDNGFSLVSAELPQKASAGELLSIPTTWRADVGGIEDLAQFLHFKHEEDGRWWGYDQQPLGARLPTRLWYAGLVDSEIWGVPLPADLAPGRYTVFTGLYRARDQERIPARAADGAAFDDARVPLGSLIVER